MIVSCNQSELFAASTLLIYANAFSSRITSVYRCTQHVGYQPCTRRSQEFQVPRYATDDESQPKCSKQESPVPTTKFEFLAKYDQTARSNGQYDDDKPLRNNRTDKEESHRCTDVVLIIGGTNRNSSIIYVFTHKAFFTLGNSQFSRACLMTNKNYNWVNSYI